MVDPHWVPPLLAAGLPLLLFGALGRTNRFARTACLGLCLFLTARYLLWRWSTPLPEGGVAQALWAWVFMLAETGSILASAIAIGFLMRTRDRAVEATAAVAPELREAPVDVFICTYNEDYAILERTILCARAILHPDMRVWVLDDGARPWVRELAEELGALYTFRVKGRHAKAGNVNNGLGVALRTGRRPEFILLLDADFAAHRNILRRTLPLFAEADVGIVQTPQHFFNPDPMQTGLLNTRSWPDEQRFFFNVLLPAKDAWGAAFCCGTSAVLRVDALIEAGGMATETVTEDMLTSFRMAEHGWRTVYLNERLSAGLAPEGLSEYVSQRARWCLGAMQQIYTRWSFAGRGRVSIANRLSALDTVLYWAVSFPARLILLLGPILFWWFGILSYAVTSDELLYWLAPQVVASLVVMGILSEWRITPILSDVNQLIIAVPIIATVGTALVRPFGRPFKVTAKGQTRAGTTIHWGLLAPFAIAAALTAGGLLFSASPWSPARLAEGHGLNIFWSLLNLVMLGAVMACCVEPPRPRTEERFATDESAQLRIGTWRHHTLLQDLSTRGARLILPYALIADDSTGELLLDNGGMRIPIRVVRHTETSLAVHFEADTDTRRSLILRLYTGDYINETEHVALLPALGGALKRVFG